MLRPERDGYLTVMGVAAGHSVACRKYSSQSVCPLNLAIQCLLRNGRLCHKPQQGRSSTEDGQNQGSPSESRRAVPQGRKANRLSDDHMRPLGFWHASTYVDSYLCREKITPHGSSCGSHMRRVGLVCIRPCLPSNVSREGEPASLHER